MFRTKFIKRLQDSAAWRVNGVRATVRSVWRLRGWDRAQQIVTAVPDPERVVVIFCVWRRLERINDTLEMLAAQTVPVQAMIWDNSARPEIVATAAAEAVIPVTVYHSDRNIGGFGRFYLARVAAESGFDKVVFVDDDQEFGPTLVADLINAHRPKSMSGWWVFTDYESRNQAAQDQSAVYVATCGMIADASIFTIPGLFTCPRRFWYLEDRWLSYIAATEGYDLYRSPVELVEFHDGLNQSLTLGWLKSRFAAKYSKKLPSSTAVP